MSGDVPCQLNIELTISQLCPTFNCMVANCHAGGVSRNIWLLVYSIDGCQHYGSVSSQNRNALTVRLPAGYSATWKGYIYLFIALNHLHTINM